MAKQKSTRRKRRRARRRPASLKGLNLYQDPRTNYYYWRRTHPLTGKRCSRATGTDALDFAVKKAAKWDEEFDKLKAGIKVFDCWTKALRPLVAEWVAYQAAQDRPPQARWLKQKERALVRALDELGLTTAADLTHLGRLEAKLRATGNPTATLRRRYQDPLKQFSRWLAGNQRHLDRDPLASWETISYEAKDRHRCLDPDEVARAFLALDWLDEIRGRAHPLRPVFTVLLVTMPRVAALTSRNVGHFLSEANRIDYGAAQGKKGRGRGCLDPHTSKLVSAYLSDRKAGPLFLSPRGARLDPRNLLRWWKEAFGLGVLLKHWPAEEVWDVETAHLLNRALLTGKGPLPRCGNPKVVKDRTRAAWDEREGRLLALAERLRGTGRSRLTA